MTMTPDVQEGRKDGNMSKLVFIGRNMDEMAMRKALDDATGNPNVMFAR